MRSLQQYRQLLIDSWFFYQCSFILPCYAGKGKNNLNEMFSFSSSFLKKSGLFELTG